MLRGRIRKFGLENDIDVLAENAEDEENAVRIALLTKSAPSLLIEITGFLTRIIPDIEVVYSMSGVRNPILSKLKCNDESRYKI